MSTPGGQESYFFTPATPAQPSPVPPTRFGHAAAAQPAGVPSAPVGATRSIGWLLAVGAAALLLIAGVVGFAVLAHKDKHTEGNTVLRPIQQADNVALDSDLQLAASAEESYLAEHGDFTSDLSATGFRANDSAQISVVSASANSFCLRATKPPSTATQYYRRGAGPSSTPCS